MKINKRASRRDNMTVKHWNTGASAVRYRDQADKQKKDWQVTLSYNIQHKDTYLIENETKEDAIYIAENQNTSSKYKCMCVDEDESDIEDEETSIKEVVFNAEKKKWLDKNGK